MCELGNRSPGIFLQAFEPLRMPENARKLIDKVYARLDDIYKVEVKRVQPNSK